MNTYLESVLDGDGAGGNVEKVAVRDVRRHLLVALFVQDGRVDQRAVRVDDRRAEHHTCATTNRPIPYSSRMLTKPYLLHPHQIRSYATNV